MSFSSLLSKIKHKTPQPLSSASSPSRTKPSGTPGSSRPIKSNSSPPDTHLSDSFKPKSLDPAIQRLKELRRLEKEKKEQELKATQTTKRDPISKPRTARKGTPSSSSSKSKTQSQISLNPKYVQEREYEQQRSSQPVKRLNFSELMKEAQNKAKNIESTKSEEVHTPKTFVSKTQSRKSEPPASLRLGTKPSPPIRSITGTTTPISRRPVKRDSTAAQPYHKPEPKPLAQPSAKLKAKLEARKSSKFGTRIPKRGSPNSGPKQGRTQRGYSDLDEDSELDEFIEDDEDDFVVDDEDEDNGYCKRSSKKRPHSRDAGYDREEIWRIMGRGKSRDSYYNNYEDDLSDMEATGADILEEEDRSAKRARMEDIKEQERERRLAEEKRRRLGR